LGICVGEVKKALLYQEAYLPANTNITTYSHALVWNKHYIPDQPPTPILQNIAKVFFNAKVWVDILLLYVYFWVPEALTMYELLS